MGNFQNGDYIRKQKSTVFNLLRFRENESRTGLAVYCQVCGTLYENGHLSNGIIIWPGGDTVKVALKDQWIGSVLNDDTIKKQHKLTPSESLSFLQQSFNERALVKGDVSDKEWLVEGEPAGYYSGAWKDSAPNGKGEI